MEKEEKLNRQHWEEEKEEIHRTIAFERELKQERGGLNKGRSWK
jgi:hypothetical protein